MNLKFEKIQEEPTLFRLKGTDIVLNEDEAYQAQKEYAKKLHALYEVEFEVCAEIKKGNGVVHISFVNKCLWKHGFEPNANDGWSAELWSFLNGWYKVNRDYYKFVKPVLHIEQ